MMSTFDKEMSMFAPGHTTVWGTHAGVSRTKHGKGWYQQLRDWCMARRTLRQQARLAGLNRRWDAQREGVKPLRADAAAEMVAAQGAYSTATSVYGLAQ
jgi:hypothetical protein